ncbi:MAG: hypothetical protein QOD14_2321 [Solirubrobacterales bacterium]|jgi:hypothetical protein|nr:hypothetical protein [Solirubrobacterales bacterium]
MAATTRQPAVSPDSPWSAKAAGPKPTVSLSLRPAASGGGRPGPANAPGDAGHGVPLCDVGRRGSAPSRQIRIFLLRSARLRSALRALSTQPLSAVLQPGLPSGVASRHRAGTAMAAARPSGGAATSRTADTRTVSWLTGIVIGHTPAIDFDRPQKEEGAGRFRDHSGPPAPFLRSPKRRQGDGSVPRRSGLPRTPRRVG